MPGISVNDNGTVKSATGFYVNDAGTVKPVLEAHVNDAGTVKKFWPAIGPPTAISNLAVTTSTSNSVTLTWSAAVANGSPVTGYEISWGTDGTTFPNTKSVGVVVTDTVTGLAGATAYYFRIRPNSALGFGGYSNVVQGTTSAATIPQAPTIAIAGTSGFTGINLRITAGGGGVPTAYEVDRAVNTNANGQSGPFTWVNIQSNLAYTGSPQIFADDTGQSAQSFAYRVRAKNGAGTSTNSNIDGTMTAGNVGGGSIQCGIDTQDVGAFKDTGYGYDSPASGGAGLTFGVNYGVSVPGVALARLARTGNTTMAIWLEGVSLDPGAFTRISFGQGLYAFSAPVAPATVPGGANGTLWITSWTAPLSAIGSWVDGAIVSVSIGK